MRYLYIHGANATSQSFNYISERLGGDGISLDYHSGDGFKRNLDRLADQIQDESDLFIVAHSLGGIYGIHLANLLPESFIGAVTISTPYGGSGAAELAKLLMPHSQLFRDITPNSWAIETAMRSPLRHPWCQIVTTKGNVPWLPSTNDGVVTMRSMRARPDMDLIDVDLNHYEIMQSPRTVEIIRERSQIR